MSWALFLTVAGLAALDSLNPATLVAIALILVGSRGRPVAEAGAFVLGAFTTVLFVGMVLYLGAEAAAASIAGALAWVRRVALGLAALVLFVSALRSLRIRKRAAIGLPSWFSPGTAAGLGVLMTAADLPNAFPYFIAVERLVTADLSLPTASLVLAGYGIVYCVPCLILLAFGLNNGEGVIRALRELHDHYGTAAVLQPSVTRATAYLIGAIIVAAIAVSV